MPPEIAAERVSSGDFHRALLDNLNDSVDFLDGSREFVYWNASFEAMTGLRADDLIGRQCAGNMLKPMNDEGACLCAASCPVAAALADGRTREVEACLKRPDGRVVPVLVRVAPVRDEGGRTVGVVRVISDNSAKIAALRKVQQLEKLVLLDPLTKLANRRHLEMRLESRLEEMRRYRWGFGVVYADIDGLKGINETHGVEAGDRILQMVGQTLANSMRSFDVVGRWAEDEFVAIGPIRQYSDLYVIGERLRAFVEQSYVLAESEIVWVTLSVGAAAAAATDSVESLVTKARNFMLQSKGAGRNQVNL